MLQNKIGYNALSILGIAASTLFSIQIAMADSGLNKIESPRTALIEYFTVLCVERGVESLPIKKKYCDLLSVYFDINCDGHQGLSICDNDLFSGNLGTRINCDGHHGINVCQNWDIDISPDGKGLPDGNGTPIEGKRIYEQQCAVCHGIAGISYDSGTVPEIYNKSGKNYPNLCGGQGTLTNDDFKNPPRKTIGSYWPYATTLFDYTRRAMPFWEPQSLDDDEVYALVAYLLYINGIIEKDDGIDKDKLREVEMPNKDGFFVLGEELKNMSSKSKKPIGVGTSGKKVDTCFCLDRNKELEWNGGIQTAPTDQVKCEENLPGLRRKGTKFKFIYQGF
jgi:hypothetical protein